MNDTNRTWDILFVDDDAFHRELYRRRLRVGTPPDIELTIIEAQTAEEAGQILIDRIPDCIVLDLHLPGVDGLAFLKRLKSDPKLMHIPVIMVTGYGDQKSAVKALKRGAQDYLQKDELTSDLMFRTVRSAIEKRRLLGQLHEQKRSMAALLNIMNDLQTARDQVQESKRRWSEEVVRRQQDEAKIVQLTRRLTTLQHAIAHTTPESFDETAATRWCKQTRLYSGANFVAMAWRSESSSSPWQVASSFHDLVEPTSETRQTFESGLREQLSADADCGDTDQLQLTVRECLAELRFPADEVQVEIQERDGASCGVLLHSPIDSSAVQCTLRTLFKLALDV